MILHFSHMGLTDARTFTVPKTYLFIEENRRGAQESAPCREQPRKVSSGASPIQAAPAVAGAPFSASARCHGVMIRGPSAVMATVCSKWAASDPSCE